MRLPWTHCEHAGRAQAVQKQGAAHVEEEGEEAEEAEGSAAGVGPVAEGFVPRRAGRGRAGNQQGAAAHVMETATHDEGPPKKKTKNEFYRL